MRRGSDALTTREHEVLGLIRLGLTNEEIAGRLGITLDGAKYHVSQILSKLGVATREDAAAVALGERRRWWAQWPFWAKIGGVATVAAAVAGLAGLAWGVVRTAGDDEFSVLRDNPLYGRIVYLAPGDESVWVAPAEQVEAAGIRITTTPGEFREAVTADTAAIIIDRDRVAEVDEAWVRELVAAGKVLVGARINISDLRASFGINGVTGGLGGTSAQYPASRLFYSLMSEASCADGQWRSSGAAADYLDRNQRGQFRLFLYRLSQKSEVQCLDPVSTASDVDGQP